MTTYGSQNFPSGTGKNYKIKDVYYYHKCQFIWPTGYIYNIGAVEVTKPFKCSPEVKFAPPLPRVPDVENYIIEDLVNRGRHCLVAGLSGFHHLAVNDSEWILKWQRIELMGFRICQLYDPWWASEKEKLSGVDIANGKHICARSVDRVENSLCSLEQGDPVVCNDELIGLVSFTDVKACRRDTYKLNRPLIIARIDVARDFYRKYAGVSGITPDSAVFSVFFVIILTIFFDA